MEAGVDDKGIDILSNTNWEIESCPQWCTVSPMSGNGDTHITIKTIDNPNSSQREGIIKAVKSGLALSAEMNIIQSGKSLKSGTEIIECSNSSQCISVLIISNGYWTAQTTDGWISVNPGGAVGNALLNVTVTENVTGISRTGKVVLTIVDKSFEISVIQKQSEPGDVFIMSDYIKSTGGKSTISNLFYKILYASAIEAPSWIKLALDSNSFTAIFADNPSTEYRSATIVETLEGGTKTGFRFTQSPRDLKVDHSEISFFAKGGDSEDIVISTDGTYSITKSASWLSIAEKGSGVFKVTAEENFGNTARKATIIITETDLKEGSNSITLPVVQCSPNETSVINGYGEDKKFDNIRSSAIALFSLTGSCINLDCNSSSLPKFDIIVTGFNIAER